MATIEPYSTSAGKRYMVRYRDPERHQRKKKGFTTKRAAEEWSAANTVQLMRGEFVDPRSARATVGDLGPAWLVSQRGHLKPSTHRSLEIAWRVHVEPRWGQVRVSDIQFSSVQSWVTSLGADKSATTVKRAFGVLSSILDEAVNDRRLLSNPCGGVKTKRKVSRAHTYLTHDQVDALAREAKSFAPLILVLAYTGLRWGEVAGLRVRDVDLKRRRFQVEQNAVEVGTEIVVGTPKTHERRSVPYPSFLDTAIRAQCSAKLPDALVFPGRAGGHMRRTRTDANSGGWFAGAVARSGVPRVTPHDLRHTAASLAISAGANVKSVQRMLGHASAAMTLDIYADLFEDDLDAVAVALNSAATVAAARRN